MRPPQDLLIDRIYLKKRINSWRIIALTFLLALILLLSDKTTKFSKTSQPKIARIYISGEVFDDEKRKFNLKKIAEDDNIKAVILHVNSPGGTFVGGEALYNCLNKLAAKKPLVVVMGTLATSVGYMISLPAHRIFSHKGTITGSIGVFIQTPNISEFSKKLGIEFVTIKSGKHKTGLSPFEPTTEENKNIIQSAIYDSYISFIDFIIEKRKIPKDLLLQIADGRIYTGNQAKELNLIDEIGDEEIALEWLESQKKIEKNYKLVDINISEKSYLQKKFKLFSKFMGFFSHQNNLDLEGVVSIW